MTPLQRLLLIPCLSPLLLTLLIGGLNLGKTGSLRILTWELPTLPIGVWMAVASTTGAVLGSGGVLAAGSSSAQQTLQREVRRPFNWQEETSQQDHQRAASGAATMPWPERDVRDPAPTVSVPFRVIRTGRGSQDVPAQPDPKEQVASSRAQASSAGGDDWNQPVPSDW